MTVFTQRQDTSYSHWSLNGGEPRYQMLGFVLVFESVQEEGKGVLKYDRFYHVYLPSYAVSLMTFIVLIALYLRPAWWRRLGKRVHRLVLVREATYRGGGGYGDMPELQEAKVVKTEGVLGGRPRIDGRRVGVHQIAEMVLDAGRSPEYVADQLDLTLPEVYAAMKYYYSDYRRRLGGRLTSDKDLFLST